LANSAVGRRRLGQSPLAVTHLGLGSGSLGNLYQIVSDKAARDTVRAAWEAGIRHFDTAPLYGSGLAETRLGQALSEFPRDDFVLSTKVGRVLDPGGQPDPIFIEASPLQPRFDFSRDAVLRSISDSLSRLRLDSVDIVHIHDPDEHFDQALNSALPALIELRAQGVIHAVGVGMNHSPMLIKFIENADLDCVLIANRYTLLDQEANERLLPLCSERQVGVVVGGVFNSGILADPRSQPKFDYRPAPAEIIARALELERICAAHRVPLSAAAIQFAAAHPAVSSVLIGARSPAEVSSAVEGMNLRIPQSLWDALKRGGFVPPEAAVDLEQA
jgi:D-threo-aldose 1-dehydrogenase